VLPEPANDPAFDQDNAGVTATFTDDEVAVLQNGLSLYEAAHLDELDETSHPDRITDLGVVLLSINAKLHGGCAQGDE
jgi:hypothetical protein